MASGFCAAEEVAMIGLEVKSGATQQAPGIVAFKKQHELIITTRWKQRNPMARILKNITNYDYYVTTDTFMDVSDSVSLYAPLP